MAPPPSESSKTPALRAAKEFSELFPPLALDDASSACDDLDIRVDDISLPSLEQEIEAHLYDALRLWNRRNPAKAEATLPYMERLRHYRAIVRWVLYENEDDEDDDNGEDEGEQKEEEGDAATRRRKQEKEKRRRLKRRRQEIAKFRDIFARLPPIQTLRESRRVSDRVATFLSEFPVKKRLLLQKRTPVDTQTSLCFEFARRPPPPSTKVQPATAKRQDGQQQRGDATPEDNVDDEEENECADSSTEDKTNGDAPSNGATTVQTVTAQTAATWRTRTLLASAQEQAQRDQATTSVALNNGESSLLSSSTSSSPGDLIWWFDILHPTKEPARTQSFLVRGSQRLTELVDLVVCAYDQRLESHGRCSKLLFFDGRFYVDHRRPENIDYSREILSWLRASPTARRVKYLGTEHVIEGPDGVGPFPMETTTIAELALKVDVPGVLIHQGECEHLLRLRDVRLAHAHDSTRREDFPMRLPSTMYRQLRSCLICSHYSAKYVCYGDRMSISDPMFFCERCYRAAHYDKDDKLVYSDFQVFPFIQE
ncbi:hypothetical protein PINS_up023090 [Pythium insidiosum]|nr:hypothetical protein PINS_up023090 [Pythium insidiosum]